MKGHTIERRMIVRHFASAVVALSSFATGVHAQVSVQGEPIAVREARAGERYAGVIVVRNGSAEVQQARVYQTDYWRRPDLTTTYGEPGLQGRSNARWISIQPRIVVPPGATIEIPYAVVVPANDSLSGSYWSMVMIETVPRDADSAAAPLAARAARVSLHTRFRYAVQLVTTVGDRATRAARFEAPTVLTAQDGTRALQFELHDTGEVAFAPTFTLDLYADDGSHVRTLTANGDLTYPGMAVRQLFALGALPAGQYKAIVTADAGNGAVFGAQYTFRL